MLKKIIRFTFMGALILTLTLFAAACASNDGNSDATSVDINELKNAMMEMTDSWSEMSEINDAGEDAQTLFTYLSDIDYSKVDNFVFSYSAYGEPQEIGIILLKNESDIEEAKKSLEKHIQERVTLFKTYAPESVATAEKAVVVSKGRCVALIMSDEADVIKTAFQEYEF